MGALHEPHPDEPQQPSVGFGACIKWKILLPDLLLRKPPSTTGTKAKYLKPIVTRRLDLYDAGDWRALIADYESDV